MFDIEKGLTVGWFCYIYSLYINNIIDSILNFHRNLLFEMRKLLLTRLLEF
jgi:hypothetical protein